MIFISGNYTADDWRWRKKNVIPTHTGGNMLRKNGSELREEVARLQAENSRLSLQIERLQESRAEYEAVVQAFEGFIYICSSRYEVEFMNERLAKRTGRNATGEKCHRVLHDLDPRQRQALDTLVDQGAGEHTARAPLALLYVY